ncbi:glycerol-3-phosphate dehydrogenase/oxidase [bacterium]|nr:glycerol-3-phosphate dehydrogenase/oxidase [bacterium]
MIQDITERRRAIAQLQENMLDLIVAGGGIVGSGIARDAGLRGLDCAIVEQYDIASGTSSKSSRLLHGGLRYLAQGRVELVHEASVEKCIVSKIAPHISAPLGFIFPTYEGPLWDQWALWKLQIGVKIYDILCMGRNLGKSRSLNPKKLTDLLPDIDKNKLTGGVFYYDGLTNDARLVIDTMRSAAKSGVNVLNYCKLISAEPAPEGWHLSLSDSITGETFELKSRCVINATGSWGEQFDQSAISLRPTKGVHLVVDRKRLPVPDAVVVIEGSRILFAIPWGERVILGTTDTDYDGRPEDVAVEQEDVDYIIATIGRAFPTIGLSNKDIIGAWAGLRPLIADKRGRPSDISRSHLIVSQKPGWWDVGGGKLTTYRLMAEQTVDRIEKYLGRQQTKCVTSKQPLLPTDETDGISAIVPPEPSRELVEHFCNNEWAVHLDDVMLRRAGWTYYCTNADEIKQQVAGWMAEILGWDDMHKQEELSNAG